ncbi:MAG: hypothetical protein M3N29_03845 [Chloroflexota bacterium]|nr:hypothetical protein [Chloroflexota bacterium]
MEEREPKRTGEHEAAGWPDDDFSADLGHGRAELARAAGTRASRPLSNHEAARLAAAGIGDAAQRVSVLLPGTRLQQGSTYIDLERLDDGPFVARAGDEVAEGRLIAAKNELDYEAWNALVGQQRPRQEEGSA